MRHVSVVGIGAGDPEHVTIQAIRVLRAADVVFLVTKDDDRAELVELRRTICDRHLEHDYRTVEIADPPRDRSAADYPAAVEDWRRRRAEAYEHAIRDELGESQRGAFLVWGDPAFYDSTLAILDEVLARGSVRFDYDVVPGITSFQALAAQHGISLTRVGQPVEITTGRRVADGRHDDHGDVVVMLDAQLAFERFAGQDVDVYWGAYVGMPDELLLAGRVADVAEEIAARRREARERKGWIMDTYLLRRRAQDG
jgi:precorrin-6A synthase